MTEGEKDGTEGGGMPPLPPGWTWERWHREVSEGVRDLAAVAKDRVRRKRRRDLGIREAKRLVRDSHDSLKNLLAMVSGGGGGGGGGEPAAGEGSPAD